MSHNYHFFFVRTIKIQARSNFEVLYNTYKRHFSDTKNTVCECLEELTDKFKEFKKNISIFCNKICKALGHKLGIHFREDDEINYDDMEYYADKVNYNYERPKKDKLDDFEISM